MEADPYSGTHVTGVEMTCVFGLMKMKEGCSVAVD
jgi:hypothetical protein